MFKRKDFFRQIAKGKLEIASEGQNVHDAQGIGSLIRSPFPILVSISQVETQCEIISRVLGKVCLLRYWHEK
jgi:hypothetical protein